ncbi:MAG: type II toxin-antitoxin system VapC family toxin [Candidatus Hydrogenedentes bacterium]|nr:type II toxin-antitoxin system VapC family toxin [Candidatus Hydrogenedentota bacterium]
MGEIVTDSSVILAWYFDDEVDDYAISVLNALVEQTPVVPSVCPLELGNSLLVAARRGRITLDESVGILKDLSEMQIRVEQEPPARMLNEVFVLARDHQLSTYDASYLDLAMRRDLPLATLDKSLQRAAGKLGVPLFTC